MSEQPLLALCEETSRPPLRYHGGKWRIAPWIIEMIPAHSVYVEVFGGAASVLFRKPRSKIEVYNDLDDRVVNFFRILRDQQMRQSLIESLELTPFSRVEFEDSIDDHADPIESARRFVIRCYMGFGTASINPGCTNGFRSCDIRSGRAYARHWAGVPDAIADAAGRFTGVTIDHMDFRKLIPKFDSPETVFYVDPPYPLSTRDSDGKG